MKDASMKLRVLLSVALIIVGLGTILYPHIKAHYFEQKKNILVEAWLNSFPVDQVSRAPISEEAGGNDFLEASTIAENDFFEASPIAENGNGALAWMEESVEGILYIEDIDLQTPILSVITDKNLNLAVCKLYPSIDAGEYGNYCLAGHRSRTYGRHFNRLAELTTGSLIIVRTKDADYSYTVSETLVVKAEDTWVLESDNSKKEITLITCDYSLKPTARLIVKGTLTEWG